MRGTNGAGNSWGGGWSSDGVGGQIIWGISFGIASAIAIKAIDALMSPREQTSLNPSTCSVISPATVNIINHPKQTSSTDGTHDQSPKTEESTATTKSRGLFHRTVEAKQQPKITGHPILCSRIDNLYSDCIRSLGSEKCDGFVNLVKNCRINDQASGAAPKQPKISVPFHLLLTSYYGCEKQQSRGDHCSYFYACFMEEAT